MNAQRFVRSKSGQGVERRLTFFAEAALRAGLFNSHAPDGLIGAVGLTWT